MKKCWVCDGKGYLIDSHVGSEIAWQGRIDCMECHGTGCLSDPWDHYPIGFPNSRKLNIVVRTNDGT